MKKASKKRRVLIIVENLSVPFDRRVWLECIALRDAGCTVSVISPRDESKREEFREVIDGISIYRYGGFMASGGFASYVLEYGVALVKSLWLMIVVMRREGFDVIQICNPPDLLILTAAPFKLVGKRIVFDQHDVCPEVYQAQKGSWGRVTLVDRALLFFERLTYSLSDVVLVVNESCRKVALSRGRKKSRSVFIVRNGPSDEALVSAPENPALKNGKRFLLVYVGMMGTQDGVDALLRSIRILTTELGRNDVHVRLLGSGAALGSLKRLSSDLGLEDIVTFAGRVEHAKVLESVATSDVCLCPDPKNPLSDKCSLVKAIEYMSLGKPFVAFDLEEVRRSAGDAALYAESGTDREYAELIDELLNDESKRSTMGERGRQRVLEQLTWRHSIPRLYEAYDLAFSHGVTDWQDRDGATSP